MPTERIQRRIDSLLGHAEHAADSRDWNAVLESVRGVFAVDPDNEDAESLKLIAEAAIGDQASEPADTGSKIALSKTDNDDQPTSFANRRYSVTRFLGEGGKKKVYLAHDSILDRDVAFAVIKTEGLDDIGRERIRREAQAMGRMGTHPCIMPIYDLGEEDGNPYMVQPVMRGGDVEELIEDADGPLPLERAIQIAKQTAQGLVFAHSKGIVHRDLKPGNIWLDDEGAAKIGDFGLAVATDRSRLTVEKLMVGTVNYMPPEQATGGEVTPRADLYSLGAMLYEMCTGRVPFMGDDDIAVISQHVNTPPVAPSWHNPSIPRTLDSLIIRLMSKNPDERPQSAEEVLQALEAVDLSIVEESSEDGAGSLDSMAGGVFVGRQREMDNLKSIFEEVLSGKGRMVMLVGEPGIGKTRTAQELATYAGMRGAQVLWGRSYESGGAPPYWPWVQAIRSHVAATDAHKLRSQMGSSASVIAEVVSDVREKLADLPEPTPIDDPESARFRLFDSIATFLKNASADTPLVLMLEDLHWSDKPSLMLLEFVARELANSRIMVVGNYRDIELNRRHPLSVTLGDLTRERLFERILLRGLQKHDVQRFIEIAAGIAPPTALVDAVYSQTEGNPLFVTETVRLLIQEGDITAGRSSKGGTTSWEIRIPEGVREVIGRRLDRLSERCNEVLTIAAVIGRQFRFDVVKNMIEDTTEGQLLDALDESLSARIVEELPEEIGLYQFTHASMQETLTEELSLARRVRLHARIAEALEASYGNDVELHAAELAHHYGEAESITGPEKIVDYSAIAGEQALSTFANEEALSHFETGLAAMGPEEKSGDRAGDLIWGLGRAQVAVLPRDRANEAVANLQRALALYAEAGNNARAVEVAQHPFYPVAGRSNGHAKLLNSALALVEVNSHDAGRLLCRYGRALAIEEGDYDGAKKALADAMSIARREDDGVLELQVLSEDANVDMYHSLWKQGLATSTRAIELAKSVDDPYAEILARYTSTLSHMAVGKPDAMQFESDAMQPLAEKLQDRFWLSSAPRPAAGALCLRGDWGRAREVNELSLAIAPGETRDLTVRVHLEYQSGNLEEGKVFLERLLEVMRNTPEGPTLEHGYAAMMISFVGRIEGSTEGFNEAKTAAKIVLSSPSSTRTVAEIARPCLGLIAVMEHDEKTAKVEYKYWESAEADVIVWMMMVRNRMLGLLAYATGNVSQASTHFEDAGEFCRERHLRPELAWTSSDYAEMLLERGAPGDRKKATELQDEAIAIATDLGMKPLLERVLSQRGILKA